MDIRNRFPDEATLKSAIAVQLHELVNAVHTAVGPLEEDYIKKNRNRKIGGVLLTAAVVVFTITWITFDPDFQDLFGDIPPLYSLGLLFLAITFCVSGWKLMKGTNKAIAAFHRGVNEALYPLVFDIFGISGQRIQTVLDLLGTSPDSVLASLYSKSKSNSAAVLGLEYQQVLQLLDHSQLITEPRNRVMVDDMVTASIDGRTLFWTELNIKHDTGSGKNRRVKKIFHGYFVSFDLPRTLEGKTFVSTEGDTRGFGHQSFFTSHKGKDVQVTQLEWNDFEKLLHVLSSNQVEARYILTTDFMSSLYDWWLDKKTNIRISFMNNRMYVLFPDKGVRMGKTITKIDERQVAGYLESIAVPLLHVLHLIEIVNQRVLR